MLLKPLRVKTSSQSSISRVPSPQVKTALLEADVNFKVVKSFIAEVKEEALGERVTSGVDPQQQFIKVIQDQLAKVMGEGDRPLELGLGEEGGKVPKPILIVGLNGAGKTTLTGKLARWFSEEYSSSSPLVVPGDNFRPAAKEQLQGLCAQAGVECFNSDLTLHPKDIAAEAMKQARKGGHRVVLVDTAGRLHVDEALMDQIAQVKKVLAPFDPEVFLVADAMTGQDAVEVAESFHQAVGLTGIVLSKMDGDARGGAALSIRAVTGVPIRFISQGEKLGDLDIFHPDRLASRILDMGDVVSLVEKAERVMDEKASEKLLVNLEKNRFTITDFMKQLETLSKMGPMSGLLKMIPGMGGAIRNMGSLEPAEGEFKKMKVIMDSMTAREREEYKILNESRLNRIARGSGTQLYEVKSFMDKFRQMEGMMVGMVKMMKGGGAIPSGDALMDMVSSRRGKKRKGTLRGKKGGGRGKFGRGYF